MLWDFAISRAVFCGFFISYSDALDFGILSFQGGLVAFLFQGAMPSFGILLLQDGVLFF